MKLLILTQKVDINDDLLGFFHGWLNEFAKHCERVSVVALGVGEYDLPDNVKVLSLGKEQSASKIKYLINFYRYIWRERDNYDTVFVHMNKEYVILGGLFWRLTGKKIGFWYQHKQVSLWLKLAEILSNVVFTGLNGSFNLKSKKVKYVGHGIDIDQFLETAKPSVSGNFKVIYVGRISRIKNQELLIRAADILVNTKKIKNIKVYFIGAASCAEDEIYKKEMLNYIKSRQLENYINFVGSIPNKEIARYYAQADLSVNLCPTGGMDKAVLESLIAGVPAIAFNKIFSDILKGYEKYFILEKAEAGELAEKILAYKNLSGKTAIISELESRVKKDFSLDKLIINIVNFLK